MKKRLLSSTLAAVLVATLGVATAAAVHAEDGCLGTESGALGDPGACDDLPVDMPVAQLSVPGQPTGLRVTGGRGQLAAFWDAPTSNGGAPVLDYRVEYRKSGTAVWSTLGDPVAPATSAPIPGLADATAYDVRVSAVNTVGAGKPCSAVTAGTTAAPKPTPTPTPTPAPTRPTAPPTPELDRPTPPALPTPTPTRTSAPAPTLQVPDPEVTTPAAPQVPAPAPVTTTGPAAAAAGTTSVTPVPTPTPTRADGVRPASGGTEPLPSDSGPGLLPLGVGAATFVGAISVWALWRRRSTSTP